MVTVVIPALNESATIRSVVRFCQQHPMVTEVMVVDDQSTDDTRQIAADAGARVLLSRERGKGISMQEGIDAAANPLIVFLDADIDPYPAGTLTDLLEPLLRDECDFVKGAFARNAGRVTELVAKPLLSIFYPELSGFQQPLSGMIAGKKVFLQRLEFFRDYGVDIGILIDMFLMQARIREVNIGYIENKSKPWQMLGRMSVEVSRAIIRRATERKGHLVNMGTLGSVNLISSQMEQTVSGIMRGLRRMVVLDMDNTLLRGRFIDACAEKYGFTEELARLRNGHQDAAVRTKQIARLLEGKPRAELLQVAAGIPLVADAAAVIGELRQRGLVVGIISDSYQFVVDYVKNKTGADFALGNQLEFFEGSSTGEVTIPSSFYHHSGSHCGHTLCKTHALAHFAAQYRVAVDNCITVGDSENDRCMIERAGLGIAFCSADPALNAVADRLILHPTLRPVLAYALPAVPEAPEAGDHTVPVTC